jgi:hypothetical protein
MASEIAGRRYALDKREREERAHLLKDHQEKYAAEYAKLKEDCGKVGHVLGRIWDNGLGWEWKICAYCGGRYDSRSYLQENSNDKA